MHLLSSSPAARGVTRLLHRSLALLLTAFLLSGGARPVFAGVGDPPPVLSPITISSNNNVPSLARIGDVVTVSFTANEPIKDVQVFIANQPAIVTNPSGNVWQARHTVQANTTLGVAAISIFCEDLAGNASSASSTTDGSTVTVDSIPPELAPVSISSSNSLNPRLAKTGDTVTLSFTANEPIQTPTVALNGLQALPLNSTGNTWTASMPVESATPDGTVTFSIGYQDLAGNPGQTVTGTTNATSVLVDKATQPPTLIAPASNSRVKSPIAVSFTIPETALSGSLKLTFFTPSAAYPLLLADSMTGAATRSFSFNPANPTAAPEIASGNPIPDGTYSVTLSYRDLVGNAAVSTMVTTVVIDTTPPQITTVTIQPAWAKAGSLVSVLFFCNETVAGVQGTIAGSTATGLVGSVPLLQANLLGNLTEGAVTFSGKVTDLAGNESALVTATTDDSACILDLTPPQLTLPANIIAEATNADGAVVTYAPTAQDNLDLAPTAQPALPSGFRFPLGITSVSVSGSDAAGNTASGSFTVTVRDTTAPTGSVAPQFQFSAGSNGSVTLGDLTGQVTASDAVGVTAITQSPASGTVLALGEHPVSFTVSDAAQNSITLDSTIVVAFGRGPSVSRTIVARTGAAGAAGPGVPPGAVLASLGTPALSDLRTMVARAGLLAGKTRLAAIYAVDASHVGSIPAVQGGAVPDGAGAAAPTITFRNFGNPAMSPSGKIAFSATLNGAAKGADAGVWTNAFGALAQLLRAGSDVPGLPAGARLKSVTSLSLRDDGLLALLKLTGAKPVVNAGQDDTALVRFTGIATGELLLRTGALRGASRLKTIAALAPAAGSPGQGRWHREAAAMARVTLENGTVELLKFLPGQPAEVEFATTGPAAVIAPAAKWKSLGVPAMGGPGTHYGALATLEQKAGGVTAANDTAVLYSADGSAWEVAAREGGPSPITVSGTPATYATFFDPVTNAAGDLALLATIAGKGLAPSTRTLLLAGLPADLEVAARLGDRVPDESGTLTGAVYRKFLAYALPGGPGAGVLFSAETALGDTTARNKLGVWTVDSTGLVRRILRTGEALETNGPAITNFVLLEATPGAFATGRSYNSNGAVAALVTLADKSQALVRIELP